MKSVRLEIFPTEPFIQKRKEHRGYRSNKKRQDYFSGRNGKIVDEVEVIEVSAGASRLHISIVSLYL